MEEVRLGLITKIHRSEKVNKSVKVNIACKVYFKGKKLLSYLNWFRKKQRSCEHNYISTYFRNVAR